jgi:hypothetical protein
MTQQERDHIRDLRESELEKALRLSEERVRVLVARVEWLEAALRRAYDAFARRRT